MWQPPTAPGADSPGPWAPPPGAWWPQPPPPRPRRSRAVVVGIVLACVVGVAVLVGAIAIAVAAGRAVGRDVAAQASAASLAADPGQATPVPTQEPLDPSHLGTDAGLNSYATRCYDGDMQACDDLYDLADPMSRYEQYAMTCGGRVKPFDVEYCTDLD